MAGRLKRQQGAPEEATRNSLGIVAALRRDVLLEALADAAKDLLHTTDLHESLCKVAERLGVATGVDRVHVFQLLDGDGAQDGKISWHCMWCAPNIEVPEFEPELERTMIDVGLGPWLPRLKRGEQIVSHTLDLEDSARRLFEAMQVKSVVCVPVFVDGSWWGTIGFDNCCSEREWLPAECATLTTLSELVAAAVARSRWQANLADAKQIVERSPTLLYRVKPDEPYSLTYISENVRQYGYEPDALLAKPNGWLDLVEEDYVPILKDEIKALCSGRSERIRVEFPLRQADGSRVWLEGSGYPRRDENNRLVAIEGTVTDVTERKAAAEQIARLARSDALTGLTNRATFVERLRLSVARAKRGAPPFAVLYLDLDHFKDVNDTLGHSVGDALLQAVAIRLRSCVRETDLVARFGGDEFAILQEDAADAGRAEQLAAKISKALNVPYTINGNHVWTTVSIGIALYTKEIEGPENLLIKADLALYRAKEEGRNQFRLHMAEFDREMLERVTLCDELRLAIERKEFELYYQPQYELASGRIVGVEALIRWHHPERGLLLPRAFIPVAETSGSILDIGSWMIARACEQIAEWRDEAVEPECVAVNLSAAQFKLASGLDSLIGECLTRYEIEPPRLELELTESMLMETTAKHMEAFERVRQIGVRLAIDDFGTGYSSLDYLRSFRVHRLKIDRRFIADLADNVDAAKIVLATIGLAHELGMEVVAEGVETKEQSEFLLSAGCELGQGNYLHKPVPAQKITSLLRREARKAKRARS